MTNYQQIPKEYFNQQVDLGTYAFNMKLTEERKVKFDEIIARSISLGAFHEDKLGAQVLITPFVVHFHQALYTMGGIGLVSSYPEYRGGGDVATLMKQALQVMNEKEIDLSYLAPFSYGFYRKYGFEQVFDHLKLTLTAEQLPRIRQHIGTMERVDWEKGRRAIKFLYAKEKVDTIGSVQREDWWWEYSYSHDSDLKFALYKNEFEMPTGYLIYKLEGDTFKILEIIYLNYKAHEMLWGFIASHGGSFSYFEYEGGLDENHAYLLEEPRIKQEIVPFMMGRIVNFQRFLKQYPYDQTSPDVLYLQVSDPTASWNDGVWQLSFEDLEPQVLPITADEDFLKENERFLIKGDIQSWTQLFLNYRSVNELSLFERLTGSELAMEELDQILPKGIPVLSDYF